MFNFTFSFAAALWALPLAAAPILLHLLFKQKSPVVQFSTLRFIKMSIQQTAARKKVQKWLLLACRALLIALLIWAIAQPVHQLTSSWLGGGGRSAVAVIVVDTSYSMQVQDGQLTLLSKADSAIQDLLRNQLSGAKVAIFKSMPETADHPEQLADASTLLAEWSPLKPQPSPKPLVDRVAAAVHFLDGQPAEEKWLVVLSDFQSKEFGHPMPELKDGRTVLLDLHVNDPRSAGITKITLNPAQPIPGIPLEADVEIAGQAGDSRAVTMSIQKADGTPISQSAPVMVTLDSSGRATKQFPVRLPAERWMLINADLTADDAMQWDNHRTRLVEVPPKQHVGVIRQSAGSASEHVLTLALDPSEGTLAEWPLAVTKVATPAAELDVIVAPLTHWPDARQAKMLRNFADSGRTVILFLSPGLEQSWPSLPVAEQEDLGELLPSAPIQRTGSSLCKTAVADARDSLLQGLTDEKYQINAIIFRQMVPLAGLGNSTTILNAVPVDPTPGSRTQGLLFRKVVGRGICFTCATLPDSQYTNLATHPTFLPLLVRMALKTPEEGAGQNVELGQPLVMDGAKYPRDQALQIEGPQHELFRVPAIQTGDARQFIFDQANEPGLYQWKSTNGNTPIAMVNVQLPASESDLNYRPADTVAPPGNNTIIATSVADLSTKVASLTAPQPQWSMPLAIVMFLLCLEALMGSWSKSWKPAGLRAFLPGMKGEAPAV
jgi:Aerotolerance regulator N-terminal